MSANNKCTTCEIKSGSSTCPFWMSDGRSFGDVVYNPRCQQQYTTQFDKQFTSSYEYRQYLIENGEQIIAQNSMNAQKRLQ